MNIPLYTQDGAKSGEVAVSERIFGQKPNNALVHKMLIMQLSNKRHPIAHTLTKGEVRGGGKKPYAQKHTGQARQGSITNPHNRGGGVAFGPRNVRNFELSASKNERRKALFCALSGKFADGRVSALESYTSDKPKTKLFNEMMKKLPFEKDVLFVLPKKDDAFVQVSRNIPRVKTVIVNYLNIADLLKNRDVVFLKESVAKLEEIFLRKK
ncbi:50S ribosomal protein L4 [Candidatus Peregrinibacteria bacterium]|nr:50S ribosomal protein L4 [Candidatus Peregrinibacteria bacterium]